MISQVARAQSFERRAIRSDADWTALLAAHAPGDALPIVFVQRGRETRATLTLEPDPTLQIVPGELAGAPPAEGERAFRSAWLGTRAGGAPGAASSCTHTWSAQAPIAPAFFPYNRCEVWLFVTCAGTFVIYTEYGGYYVDERIRALNGTLVVDAVP